METKKDWKSLQSFFIKRLFFLLAFIIIVVWVILVEIINFKTSRFPFAIYYQLTNLNVSCPF